VANVLKGGKRIGFAALVAMATRRAADLNPVGSGDT
jgi:hypothetical protein